MLGITLPELRGALETGTQVPRAESVGVSSKHGVWSEEPWCTGETLLGAGSLSKGDSHADDSSQGGHSLSLLLLS